MKKIIAMLLTVTLALALCACGSSAPAATETAPAGEPATEAAPAGEPAAEAVSYKIGICNFVDDASLNQIVDNIRASLNDYSEANNVSFEILYDNCQADANVMNQIIANFQSQNVDLMVGIATPVAMGMQAATEDTKTPVVFAAVSDPVGAGLVESLEIPGGNLTGTSDFLDTNAVMNLIFAANPDAKTVGLLYDLGQDASTAAIASAKEYLEAKGVAVVERTGTNVD